MQLARGVKSVAVWTAAGTMTATIAIVGAGVAHGGIATQAEAADEPSSLVEDYNYPGRDEILAEKHVKLLQGDGRILLADCGEDVIEVRSREIGTVCFRSTGAEGWLTVEIPRVYLGKADSHTVGMRLTDNGKTEDHTLKPQEYAPFGEGVDNQHAPTVLLKITTKS
ncbi:hypothetical protein [Amycolatopsis panacis]|uniref:Secreted protein n=1 Tax=Amycolatopsis panacis TaxID=2340917 RepID=A0A419I9Y1_9PSEU|nr:hypothetical protein [Amycolatopsis panacis]RJQ89677.1 hypothetical protein D5S19_04315 [Amycolatopsis panacis]